MIGMKIINPITVNIIKNARDGDTIRNISKRTGFAYSAAYRWVVALKEIGVLNLDNRGNRTIISFNKELIYNKFVELSNALETAERDRAFWKLMRSTKCRTRCVKGTAAAIWTQGGYITGDFFDKTYHVEVLDKDFGRFRGQLEKCGIESGKEETISSRSPFINVKSVKNIKIEKKKGLPVMPLKELVSWCKRLSLEPILEQLDLMYSLGLQARYAEVRTNVQKKG